MSDKTDSIMLLSSRREGKKGVSDHTCRILQRYVSHCDLCNISDFIVDCVIPSEKLLTVIG